MGNSCTQARHEEMTHCAQISEFPATEAQNIKNNSNNSKKHEIEHPSPMTTDSIQSKSSHTSKGTLSVTTTDNTAPPSPEMNSENCDNSNKLNVEYLERPKCLSWMPPENAQKNVVEQFFDIHQQIGKGGEGRAFIVTFKNHTNPRKFILKQIKKKKSTLRQFITEVKCLSAFQNKGVIKLGSAFMDENHYYVLTEYSGKDIFKWIVNNKGLKEESVKIIIYKILETLKFLHETKKAAHCDIKPENVILTRENDGSVQPKLIDFGDAIIVNPDHNYDFWAGTLHYMAPQTFLKERSGYDVLKADVWAIGVSAFEMLCNLRCFHGSNDREIKHKIVNNVWEWPKKMAAKLSDDAKDFVETCLTVDTRKRPSASEAMQHPWFKSIHSN